MSEERFDRIENVLRLGLTELRSGQVELRSSLADLDRRMHVLYEDLKSDIKTLRPEGPTHAEVKGWDAEVRENLGQRIDPLEAAVRHHSGEIEGLKQRRS